MVLSITAPERHCCFFTAISISLKEAWHPLILLQLRLFFLYSLTTIYHFKYFLVVKKSGKLVITCQFIFYHLGGKIAVKISETIGFLDEILFDRLSCRPLCLCKVASLTQPLIIIEKIRRKNNLKIYGFLHCLLFANKLT